jgi:hypothetical protein
MTIAERHESLTQTVELLAHDTQQMKGIVDEISKGVHGLVAIARSHEQRIFTLKT